MVGIDIQSLFADIIQSPGQRRQSLTAQGERDAVTATRGLTGRSQIFAPLVGALASSQGMRDEMLQRSVGGLFGLDTRNESEKLQQVMQGADTKTPEGQAAMLQGLRDIGMADRAVQLEQMFAGQKAAEEDRALGQQATQAQIAQAEAQTAKVNAERVKITAEADPSAARTAISTTVLDNIILTVDERGGTSVRGFDGTVYEGEEANEAIARAQQTELDRRRQMAQVAASGTISAGLAKESFDLLGGISSSLVQYAGAIDAIDDGALTGYLQRMLPTFREATVRLEQIQTEMGLGVISMTTFGALSEKELDLAIAVNAPNLPPAELRQWYNDKIAATRKLQREVEKQAIYFSDPNSTVGGWIERQQVERERRELADEFKDTTTTTATPTPPPSDERQQRLDRLAERISEKPGRQPLTPRFDPLR